jgi:hypothetical protein
MFCGRRAARRKPPSSPALRLDIFIEILLRGWVNKGMRKGWDSRKGVAVTWGVTGISMATAAPVAPTGVGSR